MRVNPVFCFYGGVRMKKYFVVAAMCAGVCAGAYWAGGRVASQKCATQIAEIRAEQQSVNLENMVNVNEKVFNTGVRDIRRILRTEYTIAE